MRIHALLPVHDPGYSCEARSGITYRRDPLDKIKFFLEGPGRQRRLVTLLATESRNIAKGSSDGRRVATMGLSDVCFHTMVDEHGNIAKQIDFDGYRFKFRDSNLPWDLMIA